MPIDESPRGHRQLSKLLDHMEWADSRVLQSLRAMPTPHARALELYAHVLGAEHTWLSRMLERASRVAVWPTLTLDEAEMLAAENAAGLREFIAQRAEGQLQQPIKYSNSLGMPFESVPEDMIFQLVLHGCYHRGQVALLVRDAGGEPSPTDYIAFARGAPAATRQPAR